MTSGDVLLLFAITLVLPCSGSEGKRLVTKHSCFHVGPKRNLWLKAGGEASASTNRQDLALNKELLQPRCSKEQDYSRPDQTQRSQVQ